MLPIPKYKLPPNPPIRNLNRPQEKRDSEVFSGVVQGKKASTYEERAARSLDKLKARIEGYSFQYSADTRVSLPGQDNQVDFMVWLFAGAQPVEIDGDWVHRSAEDKEEKKIRDALINEVGAARGWQPVIRVTSDQIETQEASDAVFRDMFL